MAQELKIKKNGKDVSGKGIESSQSILEQQLPDLTFSLLSSIVILGQGLPNRFTNNKPSGRKEVLEQLFKADYMIEDIKNRVSKRLEELKTEQRQIEDNILALNTEYNLIISRISSNTAELDNFKQFDLTKLQSDLDGLNGQLKAIQDENNKLHEYNENINAQIIDLTKKQSDTKNTEYLVKELQDMSEKGNALKNELAILDKEIQTKDNITDICPTCGQKMHGIEKPDTSKDKEKSKSMHEELDRLREEFKKLQDDRNKKIEEEYNSYSTQINSLRGQIKKPQDISQLEQSIKTIEKEILAQREYMTKRDMIEKQVKQDENRKNEIQTELKNNNEKKNIVDNRIDIDKKIDTTIKRDFRGYLLSNIITLINQTLQGYSQKIFNHTNLCIEQKGNNIEVMFNDKNYNILSGGEKQKIDIMIQLAIRDILCKYHNFSSNLFVVDEMFDFLDAKSSKEVLNLISSLSSDSIYIISHHSSIPMPIDRRIKVRKNDKGSYISV